MSLHVTYAKSHVVRLCFPKCFRRYKYANNFSGDILPLGQVSLELAESPIGEKLILVSNPTSKHVGRRRVVSLCQSGIHHTATKVLKPPRILKCLSNDEDFDYESIIQYKDVGYQDISDANVMCCQNSNFFTINFLSCLIFSTPVN